MAPAGSYEALQAAVQAGADAVYFGVGQLNMRSKSAANFTPDDLERIVGVARAAGVKSYLTVNTVIYEDELRQMHALVDRARAAGVDAVIASDLSAILYARRIGMEVHISTQCNLTNSEAVKFFSQWADVVVLARELSLDQIGRIARAIDDSAATMTQSQGVVGTAQYLSPEQARGESVDMRSDLYSAGCVLYEMLTGRPPFTGDSAVAIAYQHVSEVATPPSTIVPGLPKMWDSICAKAMAKDRQNRYATASEFKNDLLTFMNGGVPMAAAFNPLTDLTNMKARKQAEMDAATVPMAPATDAPTQAFNPVTGQFEAVPNPNGGVETKTRAEQRAKAAQERKKKQIIIASVVGSIVVLLAVIGIFFALNGHKNTADLVSVPDFTDTSNISQARVEEQLKALGLKLDARDDSTSSQPKGTITKQNPKGGKKVAKGSTVSIWFSTGPQAVSVPDVSGKTQEEAKGILEAAGFKIGNVMTVDSASIEKDKVVNTNPAANSKQTKGTIITLYISSGMTKIPDGLVGQAKDSVIAQLKQAGLTQITIESEYSDSVQSGAVTRIDPGSGSTVEMGTAVTIWVSTGKQQVSVPFVTNSTLAEAKSILEAAGFQVSVNGPQDDGATVVSMSPNGGSQADSGSTITLTTKKSSSDTNNNDTNNNGNTNNQQGN